MLIDILKIAALPLFLFLPGCLILDLFIPLSKRDGLSRLFLQVLASILLTSAISLGLADVGLFSIRILIGVLLAICMPAGLWRIKRGLPLFPGGSAPRGMLPLGWMLVGVCFLYARPHEDVGGGWDPGVYVQTGANIARTGSVNYRDGFFASLPDSEKELFTHVRQMPQRFPGFRLIDKGSGLISPQFYHLYPCWLAIAHEIGGIRAMLYVNPLFALLSLVAVYLVGCTLFDRRTAVMTLALLAANVIQIWFARFSTAEIMTQYLLWSGFYLFGLHTNDGESGYGVLAGLCFGTALFARATGIMMLPALTLVLLYRLLSGEWRRDLPLIALLGLCLVLLLLHIRFVAVAYFDPLWYVAYLARRHWLLMLLSGTLAIALSCSGARGRSLLLRLSDHRWLRIALILLLMGFAVYAYFLRPGLVAESPSTAALHGDLRRRLLSDSSAFREMSWFFTAAGLWLAVGGCMLMIWRATNSARSLLLMVALTMACFFFRSKMIEPFYMFTLRRFVPVVVPALALFAAFSVSRLSRLLRRYGTAVGWISLSLLVLLPLHKGRHVARQVDLRGLVSMCGEISRMVDIPAGAPVICDGYWLAAPLHYFYGWNTLAVSDPTHEKYSQAVAAAKRWLSEGDAVYYLTYGGRPFIKEFGFEPRGERLFVSDRLEQTIQSYPSVRKEPRCVNIRLFEAVLPPETQDIPSTVRIDVGWHFAGIGKGFLPPVRMMDDGSGGPLSIVPRMARQIDGKAEMIIPRDRIHSTIALRIEVRSRNVVRAPALVVSINGKEIGEQPLRMGMHEYAVDIPGDNDIDTNARCGVLSFEILPADHGTACRVLLESVELRGS